MLARSSGPSVPRLVALIHLPVTDRQVGTLLHRLSYVIVPGGSRTDDDVVDPESCGGGKLGSAKAPTATATDDCS